MPEDNATTEVAGAESQEETESKELSIVQTDGIKETCAVCKHPARDSATEIYYENNRNVDSVVLWFKNKYNKPFNKNTMTRHFKEHVEPFVKAFTIQKEKKVESLKERMSKEDTNKSKLDVIKAIIYDLITDWYGSKPDAPITKEDKTDLQRSATQIKELTKVFLEIYKMEFTILGIGKSEEEQRELIRNYMIGMIKNIIDKFGDIPEAQQRLQDIFETSVSLDNIGEE